MFEKDTVVTDEILCRSEYDIDENGNICTGKTTLIRRNGIYYMEVGKEGETPNFSYEVDSLKRLSIVSNIGCATLEADFKDGPSVRLCRMTQSCVKPLSEFIKVINYYLETGEMTEMKEEHSHCPKCGKEIVIRKTKKGRRYYGCEAAPDCDFMSWQKPSDEIAKQIK